MRRDTSHRILAEGVVVSNDTWTTGINNNTLIVGSSGAGKTRGFVIPNILASEGSIVVTDTKGELYDQLRGQLQKKGFVVGCVDFIDPLNSTFGYDPLQQIRFRNGKPREQDVLSVSAALCPAEHLKEPYWDNAAQGVIASLIAYALEALPENEGNLNSVCALYEALADGRYDRLIDELAEEAPNALAVRQFSAMKALNSVERTAACIRSIAGEKLAPYRFGEISALFTLKNRIRFENLRRFKTALFVNVSDCDRSMDRLIAMFYGQMFKALIESDSNGFPVHVILDDFACGCKIKDFDNYISVIRSRGIYTSIIIQSISQLRGLYQDQASNIVENCDTMLYLGGNDPETARIVGMRLNRPPHTILSMPVNEAFILRRGQPAQSVRRRFEPCPDDGPDEAERAPREMALGR